MVFHVRSEWRACSSVSVAELSTMTPIWVPTSIRGGDVWEMVSVGNVASLAVCADTGAKAHKDHRHNNNQR